MKPYLKYTLRTAIIVIVVFSAYWLFLKSDLHKADSHKYNPHHKEYYTCPMHPEIIRGEPGKCPICGMALIKKVTSGESTINANVEHLLNRTDKYVTGDFEITAPIDTTLNAEIILPGYIEYDQNAIINISARITGRIEKMYVNYKFQKINKGQKLFDLYSPELLTEQQNLIYLLNNDPENKSIIKAAKEKLLLYGMSSGQINSIVRSRKINPVISIYSPVSGVIKGTASMSENKTSSMEEFNVKTGALNVKEGDYITKGKTVFELINTDTVWAVFNVLQGYNSLIKVNQPISFTTEMDKSNEIQAKINFIETQLNSNNKSNRIRVYLKNKSQYPIGLRLQAKIRTNPISGLWIHKQSQVSIGSEKIVFVKIDNGFMAKRVQLGVEINDYIKVLGGISKADAIAKNAQYFMDSESFIKVE